MQNSRVIIGASYGDEGKGLATDFFGAEAACANTSCVTVLTNGGPQRGHTVELADGRRHVFKHFGSASLRGAESYFGPKFLVNPMQFVREYEELAAMDRAPAASVHPGCRFTTPYDVLVNQMTQVKKGQHNSCGFGIWETVLRYRRGAGVALGDFLAMDREGRTRYLRGIRDGYYAGRMRECGLAAGDVWEVWFEEGLLQHYLEDCELLARLCPVRREAYLQGFGTVLFENGQGLLLDGNRRGEEDFTTPSTTGLGGVLPMIEGTFRGAEVEVCYVTRSYLTRHGDGPLEGADSLTADADSLTGGTDGPAGDADSLAGGAPASLPGIAADRTNPANRFQGRLRYGMMKDTETLADRIGADFALFAAPGRMSRNLYRPSVMVTHLNEHQGIDTGLLGERFGTVYLSDGRTNRDVERQQDSFEFI